MKRVGFYAEVAFFRAILEPVRAALDGRATTLLGRDRNEMLDFRPHVLILSAPSELAFFRRHLPETRIGLIGHGLLRKGRVRRLAQAASGPRFDFICVGDESLAGMYRLAGAEPGEFWYTGFPLLDRFFRGEAPPSLPLDRTQPTVLFAPTWNLGLSAAPVLGERLVELIRGTGPPLNVLIKPHPNIHRRRRRWVRWWQRLAAADERVHLVADADADVTQFMLAADVLVSDASSAILLFLALDRPIVLVTNPDHRHDPEYDAEDVSWQWRDLGIEVTQPEQLPAAVARSLARPDEHSPIRQRYAERLFGSQRDGRNSERIAGRIEGLLATLPDELPAILPGGRAPGGPIARLRHLRRWLLRQPRYAEHVRGAGERLRLWAARRGARRRSGRGPS